MARGAVPARARRRGRRSARGRAGAARRRGAWPGAGRLRQHAVRRGLGVPGAAGPVRPARRPHRAAQGAVRLPQPAGRRRQRESPARADGRDQRQLPRGRVPQRARLHARNAARRHRAGRAASAAQHLRGAVRRAGRLPPASGADARARRPAAAGAAGPHAQLGIGPAGLRAHLRRILLPAFQQPRRPWRPAGDVPGAVPRRGDAGVLHGGLRQHRRRGRARRAQLSQPRQRQPLHPPVRRLLQLPQARPELGAGACRRRGDDRAPSRRHPGQRGPGRGDVPAGSPRRTSAPTPAGASSRRR